jgi:hypothetical protein
MSFLIEVRINVRLLERLSYSVFPQIKRGETLFPSEKCGISSAIEQEIFCYCGISAGLVSGHDVGSNVMGLLNWSVLF